MEQPKKEVEIVWNGAKHPVVLKRFTLGERNEVARQSTTVKPISGSGEPLITIDPFKMKEMSLLKGIMSAPFPIDIQSILSLDFELADYLYGELEKLNSVDDKKKE